MSEQTHGLTPHDVLAAAVTDAGGSPCQQDAELWFGTLAQQTRAADSCLDCPAFFACQDYLKDNPERFGTWAATTEFDRNPTPQRPKKKDTK